jgi:hypothetical protein
MQRHPGTTRVINSASRTGTDLLAHIGTREAARDLDVLRSALGAKVTYLGYSYGTRKIDINRIAPGRANLTAVAGRGFDLGSHQPTDRCSHCEDQQLCLSKCGPDTDGARRPHPRPSAEDVPSSVQLRWRPADHQADHR